MYISRVRRKNILLISLVVIAVIVLAADATIHLKKWSIERELKASQEQIAQLNKSLAKTQQEITNSQEELQNSIYPILEQVGLVAYWSFDNNTITNSTIKDMKGHNDAVNHGAIFTPEGKFGGAMEFDGKKSYISIGSISFSNATEWSVSFWAKPISIDQWQAVFGSEDFGNLMMYHTKNSITFRDEKGRYNSVDIGSWINVWSHIVIIVDNTATMKFYRDGYYKGSIKLSTSEFDFRLIGRDYLIGDRHFNGIIDEVKIWNRALTPAEISYLANKN